MIDALRRLWAWLPDRYLLLAFANLGTMIPLLDSVFRYLKGHGAPDDWWHITLPGIAMAVGGQFGNCMVIAAALDMSSPLPKVTRGLLLGWSAACFAATLFLVQSYMLAEFLGKPMEELLSLGMMGMLFYSFLLMAEGPTPALLYLSRTLQATAASQRKMVDAEKAGTPQLILVELAAAERTVAQLAIAVGVTSATVGNKLKALMGENKVHKKVMPGGQAALWALGPAL